MLLRVVRHCDVSDKFLALPRHPRRAHISSVPHDLHSRNFQPQDILCGIAASGRTPYVLGAIDEANRLGATTIGISCAPDSELSRRAKIAITPTPGPEIIAGSTRLKAGTATKVVLNLLSTCAMVRLGRVRGNSMVDLRISNAKLRDRGVRLVSRELRISYEEARERLEKAGWNVRAALS